MDTLEVIDKLNAFYSTSFSELMWLTIAIITVVGVVVPVLINYFQSRTYRISRESLESLISGQIELSTSRLREEVLHLFEDQKKNMDAFLQAQLALMKTTVDERTSVAKAGTFFLQAYNSYKNKEYAAAARDYAYAADLFFFGKDDLNGQRGLTSFVQACLPVLKASDFETQPDLDGAIDDLLSRLKARNENGRFSDSISQITHGRLDAKKRQG